VALLAAAAEKDVDKPRAIAAQDAIVTGDRVQPVEEILS
jgi:hypothetical protein